MHSRKIAVATLMLNSRARTRRFMRNRAHAGFSSTDIWCGSQRYGQHTTPVVQWQAAAQRQYVCSGISTVFINLSWLRSNISLLHRLRLTLRDCSLNLIMNTRPVRVWQRSVNPAAPIVAPLQHPDYSYYDASLGICPEVGAPCRK